MTVTVTQPAAPARTKPGGRPATARGWPGGAGATVGGPLAPFAPFAGLGGLGEGPGGPLYRRLTAVIRRAVDARRLAPGDALPAERELAAQLGVSRVTVRRALGELVEGGVLEQRRGSGTYVAGRREPVRQRMSRLTSFSEDMRARGAAPGSRWLERGLAHPAPSEALALGLSPGDPVWRLARVRTADGAPMAVDRTVVPAAMLPGPELPGGSLYAGLERAGHRPVRALQRVRAVVLAAAEAVLLEVPEGAAAVDLERVAFDEAGRAIELTRSHYRGDAYDFVAELRAGELEPPDGDGGREGPRR